MFASYSIRAKITAVVAFLLVMMTCMGLLAVRSMQAINANAVDIQSNWLPNVRVLGELQKNVIQYRSIARAYLLADTAADKEVVGKRYDGFHEANIQIRRNYEKQIRSPEERALYDEWSRQWDVSEKSTEQVMALSRKELGGVPHQAIELNERTVNPQAMKSDDVLKKMIDFNNGGADAAAKAGNETYGSAFMLVVIILGLATLVGIGIGFYLVRDVSRGIASIVTPMQALGNGDLTANVPHQGEATEIGSMASALQIFKDALIAKRSSDEAAELDAGAKIQRGLRVDSITRDFETMIGEIVDTGCRRRRPNWKRRRRP